MSLRDYEQAFWDWFDDAFALEDASGDSLNFDSFVAELQRRTFHDGYARAYWWAIDTYLLRPLWSLIRSQWAYALMLAWVWGFIFINLFNAPQTRQGPFVVDTWTSGEAAVVATGAVVLAWVAGRTGEYIYQQAINEGS